VTLIQIVEDEQPEITSVVEYLRLRRRVETVSPTLAQKVDDLVKKLHAEEGNMPTVTQLWDRLIARAIKDERAPESKTESK
jgi:hypothetical protein